MRQRFFLPRDGCESVVHGDDFTGTDVELRKVEARLREWFDVKVRGILGRVLSVRN